MVGTERSDEFAEGKRRIEEVETKLSGILGKDGGKDGGKGGGLLGGLGTLFENLVKLVEESEQSGGVVTKSGEFSIGTDKRSRGVYGFSIKTGLGDKGPKVEPFGNIRRDERGSLIEVQEIREPIVDVFDESDHVLIVAEVPGITDDNVKLELADDILTLSAENGDNRYRKEILLPASFTTDQMTSTCRNGMLEVRLTK